MDIIVEQPQHAAAIESLLDQAFGIGRIAKTSYRLREGVAPISELCFVMVESGQVEGTIRHWPVRIAGSTETVPALLLGPIAVAAHRRGDGLGVMLMRHSLERAAALGYRSVLLVGDAPYYGRFGFTRALTLGLSLPGPVDPERFLGLELVPNALAGLSGPVERWLAAEAPAVFERRQAGMA